MLTIWGRNNSSNVQKVMWMIGELELPHQRHDVGGAFGKTKEEPYLSMNPNSVIPTIQDGSFTLWESNAILRYLAMKHHQFLPVSLHDQARVHQWLDWQQTVMGPSHHPGFLGAGAHPCRQARSLWPSRQGSRKDRGRHGYPRQTAGRTSLYRRQYLHHCRYSPRRSCLSLYQSGERPAGARRILHRWYQAVRAPALPIIAHVSAMYRSPDRHAESVACSGDIVLLRVPAG